MKKVKINNTQLRIIKEIYNQYLGSTKKHFVTDELELLHDARIRLHTFTDTVGALFNCDFYEDIEPIL